MKRCSNPDNKGETIRARARKIWQKRRKGAALIELVLLAQIFVERF